METRWTDEWYFRRGKTSGSNPYQSDWRDGSALWAKNGEAAGTAGLAKRLEGIQIVLVPKNGKAPATRYQGITSVRTQAYIKK